MLINHHKAYNIGEALRTGELYYKHISRDILDQVLLVLKKDRGWDSELINFVIITIDSIVYGGEVLDRHIDEMYNHHYGHARQR